MFLATITQCECDFEPKVPKGLADTSNLNTQDDGKNKEVLT